MKKIIIFLSFIFILTACNNEDINEKHAVYIENLGWTIKSFELN